MIQGSQQFRASGGATASAALVSPRPAAGGERASVGRGPAPSRDVDASLSITTKEGDTFSISASFDASATYANVRGDGDARERVERLGLEPASRCRSRAT